MVLARLLGDFPPARFLEEFYFRLPYPRPGGAAGLVAEFGWDRIRALVEAPGADVLLSRRGELDKQTTPPTFEEARARYGEGCTITVRRAERHDAELGQLAADFRDEFQAPVDIHLYRTPAGEHGFGWHYDVEDVFILQLGGAKRYSLRKNTVNPWPVLETMPRDLKFEREGSPVFDCRLDAGDWLYIPAGWWHLAETERESTSLAVGLMSPTALDLVRYLEGELAKSVIWRQRLPAPGDAQEDLLAGVFKNLGRDLAMVCADPLLARKFLASRPHALESRIE